MFSRCIFFIKKRILECLSVFFLTLRSFLALGECVLEIDENFIFLQTIYNISFGQIYVSKPMMTESDGEMATLFPKAARLRNLTYSAPLYVDVCKTVIMKGHDGEEVTETQDFTKVFIGKVCELCFCAILYKRLASPIRF